MLSELRVRDLAVAEAVDLVLGPGLTVITGETGAGKSILVDALALALGARADTTAIRAGAAALTVAARFDLPPGPERDRLAARLRALDIPFDGELLVSRTVPVDGRSTVRLNDHPVLLATLAEVGQALADIHGQHDHLSLLRPAEQLRLLDRFAGLDAEQAAFAATAAALREVRRRLRALSQDNRDRARRVAQLRFEAEEVEAARLEPEEDQRLEQDIRRLAHAQDLAAQAEAARAALEEEGGAADALGAALAALRRVARLDPEGPAAALAALETALDQAGEALRQVRAYRDDLDLDPAHLAAMEERLALIHALQRKYGDTVAAILAHAGRARAEAEDLDATDARLAALRGEEERLHARAVAQAQHLAAARREHAATFIRQVVAEAGLLHLPDTDFRIAFGVEPDPDGLRTAVTAAVAPAGTAETPAPPAADGPLAFDDSGVDRVTFLVSFNPGQPPRPLARVASGGETARFMLAIKSVLGRADAVPTLVFDEVDAGLGGRGGAVVGQALARLAALHQVLCITHLPQVAAYADAHLRVRKSSAAGDTRVGVDALHGDGRVAELAAMLGGATPANRRAAQDLLAARAGAAATTGRGRRSPAFE